MRSAKRIFLSIQHLLRKSPPMDNGLAQDIQTIRSEVLRSAYKSHPERFVKKLPVPPSLPKVVWINKPKRTSLSEGEIY